MFPEDYKKMFENGNIEELKNSITDFDVKLPIIKAYSEGKYIKYRCCNGAWKSTRTNIGNGLSFSNDVTGYWIEEEYKPRQFGLPENFGM